MKNENLTIVRAIPHAHKAGRGIETKIVRNNKIIGFLSKNKHFNYSFQRGYDMNPPINLTKVFSLFDLVKKMYTIIQIVFKVDSLITECTYTTSEKKKFTFVKKIFSLNKYL